MKDIVLAKDKEIKKEINRLKRIFKDVTKLKTETLQGLIEECAFMRATLKELKILINENGFIDEMPQGSYSITRESPYVKIYNSMIQRYTVACDKLLSLFPKEERKSGENDILADFVKDRDK